MSSGETEYYPLTHAQRRIWYVEKLYPHTPMFNLGGTITFKGKIDLKILESSLRIFFRKNDSLSLRFVEKGDQVIQYFTKTYEPDINYFDYRSAIDPALSLKAWVYGEAMQKFTLVENPLVYIAIFRMDANVCGYFVKFHHLISDGWSMNLLTQQVCEVYDKLSKDVDVNDAIEFSFQEYIPIEQQFSTKERFFKDRLYWKEKFEELPESFLITSSDSILAERKTFYLDENKTIHIREFVKRQNISMNTFFMSIMLIYLQRILQQNDIIVGTPVLNRSGRREKNTFGMFINMMPFRKDINENAQVIRFMDEVNRELINSFFHQKYPFDILVKDIDLQKKGYDQLFQICVNYSNAKLAEYIDGVIIENEEFFQGHSIYSLHLLVKDWYETGSLRLDLEYKVNDYSEKQITAIFYQLEVLIDQIIDNPLIEIASLDILTNEEKTIILNKFNSNIQDIPQYKTISLLFEEQVRRSPDKVALIFEDQEITYNQLNRKANQLAAVLRNKGIGSNTIVAVMVERSVEMMVSLLGISKAGGAYLPIDPEYPQERIEHMLQDSNALLLVTQQHLMNRQNYDVEQLFIERNSFSGDVQFENQNVSSRSEDLAYLIYTSGSTGKPKGVMITHKAVHNFFAGLTENLLISQYNAILSLTTISFDIFVLETLFPLTQGLKIVLASDTERNNFNRLADLTERYKIDMLQTTPSKMNLMLSSQRFTESLKKIKILLIGGEPFPLNLLQHLQRFTDSKIFNMYGPTEATIWCTMGELTEEDAIHIGKPLSNTQIYIVDNNHRLQPIGMPGQLCIAGIGLAAGYIHQPELTSERFVDNPYVPGSKMYKSGDWARWLADGRIEYLGRIDQQVKYHGYRIELEEIEAQLLKHEAILEAAVIVLNRNDSPYLCAYYSGNTELKYSEIRAYLIQYLPLNFIPARYVLMNEMPLTPNGKINRKALPKPHEWEQMQQDELQELSEKEQIVVTALQEILDIPNINVSDNFFQLGGDSIKALQFVNRMYEQGINIEVKEVMYLSTLYEIAVTAEYYIQSSQASLILANPCEGIIKNTPMMGWLMAREFSNIHHWHQSICLDLKVYIDDFDLKSIFNIIIKYQDSFRLNLNEQTKEFYYNENLLFEDAEVFTVDLSKFALVEQLQLIKETGDKIKASFNLTKGALIKACLFDCGVETDRKLLIVAHRLSIDFDSWRMIANDLYAFLDSIKNNQPINLPLSSLVLQTWSEKLELDSQSLYESNNYWPIPIFDLDEQMYAIPFDVYHKESMENHGTISTALLQTQTEEFIKANHAYNTKSRELLIVALVITIHKWLKQNEIWIEIDFSERTESSGLNMSRTIGCLTNIYPLLFKINENNLSAQIKEIKEQYRNVPNNGLSYGLLPDLSKRLIPPNNRYIRLSYSGDLGTIFENDLFNISELDSGRDSCPSNTNTYLIDFQVTMIRKRLEINVFYDPNEFTSRVINELNERFCGFITEITAHCNTKEGKEFTPSDFDLVNIAQSDLDLLFG